MKQYRREIEMDIYVVVLGFTSYDVREVVFLAAVPTRNPAGFGLYGDLLSREVSATVH